MLAKGGAAGYDIRIISIRRRRWLRRGERTLQICLVPLFAFAVLLAERVLDYEGVTYAPSGDNE